MRLALLIIGILASILGTWWILQGTGIVPIGFMANHMEWAWRGGAVLAVGIVLIVVSRVVGRKKS